MTNKHTTQRLVSYKSLPKEKQTEIQEAGFDLKNTIYYKEYETKMSAEFFEWLESCPVKFMFIRNNNYNCHYSFYFNGGDND